MTVPAGWFVKDLQEADIQDSITKEREMQSYIEERREVAEREATWKVGLSSSEVITVFLSIAVLTLKPQTINVRCSCLHALLCC